MNLSDITFILKWWLMFFVIGLIFLPLTTRIFSNFFDKGYIFSRILGMALISYAVFVLGILKIAPFTTETILVVTGIAIAVNIFVFLKDTPSQRSILIRSSWKLFFFEEILFLATLFFWSFIRAHEPSIHGLEKYMDFGFVNSIIRSGYFPPKDMWLTPHSINYYYFGHLVTAILTKLSYIPSSITYNLMLSTIFALTFTASFSIGANLIKKLIVNSSKLKVILAGLLTGFLVSMAGNLHAIYAFFKPYVNESPIPFWQLAFSPQTFQNSYWYPNATRFIQNTIHEFPIYSFVVSDLHGHFLDIPFVLLIIAILFSLFINLKIENFKLKILLISFLLAVMYMTNAWDGIIYFILALLVFFYLNLKISPSKDIALKVQSAKFKVQSYLSTLSSRPKGSLKLKLFSFELSFYALRFALYAFTIMFGFLIFSLPFNLNFKPFAAGIGVLCAPEFLTNIETLGPFLFEKDHCLRSPIWQLLILYGFFYFWAISFIIFLFKKGSIIQSAKFKVQSHSSKLKIYNSKLKLLTFNFELLTKSDLFVLLLIIFSTLLIIIPEFIYIKDIYPGHYRANTMFKLVYQAFIMLSIASGYIIIRVISNTKYQISNIFNFKFVFFIFSILFFILVMIYPYFAINSYYGDLKTYYSLDGTLYLKKLYPTDYSAILWINKNIKGQPIILEAQGDSYTDYARVSSNTGLPTVLGWTVHEWLWRGSYDIPSPRIEEVKKMYESIDIKETKQLLNKHNVSLIFIGDLEREKYPNLNEEKFKSLGKIIYKNGNTKIYQIN